MSYIYFTNPKHLIYKTREEKRRGKKSIEFWVTWSTHWKWELDRYKEELQIDRMRLRRKRRKKKKKKKQEEEKRVKLGWWRHFVWLSSFWWNFCFTRMFLVYLMVIVVAYGSELFGGHRGEVCLFVCWRMDSSISLAFMSGKSIITPATPIVLLPLLLLLLMAILCLILQKLRSI